MADAFDPSDELDTDIVDNLGGDAAPYKSPTGPDAAAATGECSVCGLPGIIGMNCSDPDCSGSVQKLPDAKPLNPEATDSEPESDRYDEALLKDDSPEVVSLEELADSDDEDEDAETL